MCGSPRTGTTPQTPVTPGQLPDAVPEPWREVFAALSGGRSYVLEDALFSMMAHISYDLPVAMRRMAVKSDVDGHIADFHQMNDVLGLAIDFTQDELASRYCWWLADLDRIFARQDELFSNYGIRVARGMAWFNFSRLTDPEAADDAERSIRTSTGAFIRQVREPDWWALRVATRAGRLMVPGATTLADGRIHALTWLGCTVGRVSTATRLGPLSGPRWARAKRPGAVDQRDNAGRTSSRRCAGTPRQR